MFNTLYVRMISYYIAAVLIGVVVAWALALYIFQESDKKFTTEELIQKGDSIKQLYIQSNPNDLDMFLQTVARMTSVGIKAKVAGQQELEYINWPNEENFCNCSVSVQETWQLDEGVTIIELIESEPVQSNGLHEIAILLTIVLLIGSLIFLLFAKLLVKPIHQVTRAAKQLATGDFNVQLPETRQDEVGLLSKTMNSMALKLGQLDRERIEFVANVSHEFQSPLTVIKGFASMLQEEANDENMRRRISKILIKESERLSNLSDNLLRLASLDSDRYKISPSHFDVAEQVRRTILSFEPIWSEKKLVVEMCAEETMIEADEELLNQVWYNLMSNSIKFTSPGGRIKITIEEEMNFLKVKIFDNGLPISIEERKKIFGRFYKVDRARNRKMEGNGLGLSIVKKIISIHNGSIQVVDEEDGKAFVVHIPKSI
ncbi:ATP-binding protein [Bacillus salitolerans]|uniref:Heme sensor protein HssS n=1 Tax=Bacillus salitolerans TaxID=1437434 RepID=A0ABW4LXA5_9BACI